MDHVHDERFEGELYDETDAFDGGIAPWEMENESDTGTNPPPAARIPTTR